MHEPRLMGTVHCPRRAGGKTGISPQRHKDTKSFLQSLFDCILLAGGVERPRFQHRVEDEATENTEPRTPRAAP